MSQPTIRFAFREFRDPDTGARVVRLTPPGAQCQRNYFYQKAFTNDGRFLIFGCDLGGAMNLWELELASGEARQLSFGKGENIQGAYLSADDRSVYFSRGARFHVRVDRQGGAEEVVYEVPSPWVGYGTWGPNTDTTKTLALLMHQDDRVTGGGWEKFAAQYHAQPRQRLVEIDLTNGASRVVWEEKRHLGHPMYRPDDDAVLGFCHEGPHDLVDSRIWLIGSDGTNLTRVKEHAPGESIMHEFWVPDGSRLLYVSYTKGQQERFIGAATVKGLGQEVLNERLMAMPPCAHLMSNRDGTLLVGDGAGQLGDVADQAGHAFAPDPFLHLFDLKTRTHSRLCGHQSSWRVYGGNTQASHPHPSFTPDETRVLFASDFEGDLALYLVDVKENLA